MIGTIHHLICPNCGNQTVDPQDGECKYAYCDEQRWNDEQSQLPLDEQMDRDFRDRHPDSHSESLWD